MDGWKFDDDVLHAAKIWVIKDELVCSESIHVSKVNMFYMIKTVVLHSITPDDEKNQNHFLRLHTVVASGNFNDP